MVRCEKLAPWTVVGGNPVMFVKKRELSDAANG